MTKRDPETGVFVREKNSSKEEILKELKNLLDEHGKLTQSLVKEKCSFSLTQVRSRLDSFSKAKSEAGVIKAQKKVRWQDATEEEILDGLHECYEENGKITQNLLAGENLYPTLTNVNEHFETLSMAKIATGIDDLKHIRLSDKQLEKLKPELIEQIEECEEKYGKVSEKLMRKDDEFWNPGYIQKAFGTFSKAKSQADLTNKTQIHLTNEELNEINEDLEKSKYKQDIITGLLLGDGTVYKPKKKSARLTIEMIEKDFLEWVNGELGDVVSHITLRDSAEEAAEKNRKYGYTVNEENYNDIYRLQSRALPVLNKYYKWYETGQKRFPDNLELNPTICKMWYCCDGSLAQNESCVIYSANEIDRPEFLENLFKDSPLNPTISTGGGGAIKFGREESREFLEWLGSPPNGFEYKWNINE